MGHIHPIVRLRNQRKNGASLTVAYPKIRYVRQVGKGYWDFREASRTL